MASQVGAKSHGPDAKWAAEVAVEQGSPTTPDGMAGIVDAIATVASVIARKRATGSVLCSFRPWLRTIAEMRQRRVRPFRHLDRPCN